MSYGLRVVTAPSVDVVTLAEAKTHLRVDHANDDTLISALIVAAREHLEGRAGWLGRALNPQTWELLLDCFPVAAIYVPLAPLTSVTSITYLDTDGASQTLPVDDYVVDAVSEPGRIVPALDASWPATRGIPNAVTVRFICGYPLGAGSSVEVPRPIRTAMLGIISDLYDNRSTTVATPPAWIRTLLEPYRVRLF